MEDLEIIKYRERRHKCKWCKYYKNITGCIGGKPYEYNKCKLKDKVIYFIDCPTFCKYYKNKMKRRIK